MRPERDKEKTTHVGQSEVVGLVLVFGITFLSIGVILATGIPSLNQAEELAQIERIQTEFTSLDQEIRESVYTTGQSGASVSLSEGGVSVDSGSTMAVNVTHRPADAGLSSTTMGWRELGGLLYETGDSGVAYQMGGVWYTDDTGFAMNSPPDVNYRGSSLKMDMTNFTQNVTVGGTGSTEFTIRSEGTETVDKPTGSLPNGTLDISVRTEYDEAWTEYFNRTFGEGNVDGSGGYANASVRTGPPLFGVEYLGDRYENGSGSNVTTVYDSRIGNVSEYNYTVDTDTVVTSKIDPLPVTEDDIDEAIVSPTGAEPTIPSSGSKVTAGDYRTTSGTDLSGHTFDTSSGRIRYLSNSDVDISCSSGVTVEFNTTGGPVEIHTPGDLSIDCDISVNGNNPVYIYAEGDTQLDNDVTVTVKDDRTELFQIYSGDNADIPVEQIGFNGTLYAPRSDVKINSNADVRGAVIGDSVTVGNADYYHDASLRQADVPEELNPPLRHFMGVEHKISMR